VNKVTTFFAFVLGLSRGLTLTYLTLLKHVETPLKILYIFGLYNPNKTREKKRCKTI